MSLTNRLADLSLEYLDVVDTIEDCEANQGEHADAIEVLAGRRDDLLQTIAKRLTNAGATEASVTIGESLILQFEIDRNQSVGLHLTIHVDGSDTGHRAFDRINESN